MTQASDNLDLQRVLDEALVIMDQELERAKQTMACIKPDIAEARLRAQVADDSIALAAEVLLRLQNAGSPASIETIDRVNRANREVLALASEIVACVAIVARSDAKAKDAAASQAKLN